MSRICEVTGKAGLVGNMVCRWSPHHQQAWHPGCCSGTRNLISDSKVFKNRQGPLGGILSYLLYGA